MDNTNSLETVNAISSRIDQAAEILSSYTQMYEAISRKVAAARQLWEAPNFPEGADNLQRERYLLYIEGAAKEAAEIGKLLEEHMDRMKQIAEKYKGV